MARSTLVRTVVLGVALALAIAPGCAKQGEGERCEPNAARDSDCDDGLECVPGKELLNNVQGADDFGRCCPLQGQPISDERCTRSGGSSDPGMNGSAGEAGATSSAGATGSAGDTSTNGGAGGEPASSGGASGDGGTPSASGATAGGQSGATSTAGAGGA
jgi:hypothetical protein